MATDIAESMGRPLLITSVPHVNEERDYYVNGELLEEKFGKEVELVIESDVPTHQPSTVVDYTGEEAEIIRQGVAELSL